VGARSLSSGNFRGGSDDQCHVSRHNPHINAQGFASAQSLELTLLQHSQEQRLHFRGHLRRLLLKQGSAVRLLKPLLQERVSRNVQVCPRRG